MLSAKFGPDLVSPWANRGVYAAIYARPLGFALGAFTGMAAALAAMWESAIPALDLVCGAMAVVAALRFLMASDLRRLSAGAERAFVRWYPAFAYLYAALAGLAAATAMLRGASHEAQMLLLVYAMAYGAGMSLGNAGRPIVALGQMALAFVPVVLAALLLGSPLMLVLAAILPVLATGLAIVTLKMFRVLSDQIATARQSTELAEQMKEQARTDPITRLANREGFERAVTAVMQAGRPGSLFIFWLDLHRFTEVNDMLGHQVGDQVLREVGQRLRARCPEDAIIARFGSDEFLVATVLHTHRQAEDLAGAISTDLAAPIRIAGHRIESGASIGVAEWREGGELENLMQQADIALYHAKIGGRYRICHFDRAMTRNLVRRKEIETELRAAIMKDELSIYFQPILDLGTGRIRAFEALVRWFHPEKGELVPEEFIPVAEETGLIITLGNWITRQAARTCASWPEHVHLAVNLSPVQIRAPGAALGILHALEEAGLDPSRLELEVTENLFVDDNADTAQFMDQLSGEGVRFALDDFGTGYSSLHYINKYPFRTIKVDRSFVSGPNTGRRSDAIIRAVAEMGNTLGLEIVAEGLETAEQVAAVRRAGCTLGQGYFFSRAVPDHLAAHLLAEEKGAQGAARLAG